MCQQKRHGASNYFFCRCFVVQYLPWCMAFLSSRVMLFVNEPRSIGIVTVFFCLACSSARDGGSDTGSIVREVATAAAPDVHESSIPGLEPIEDTGGATILEDGRPRLRTPRRGIPGEASRRERRAVEPEPWALPMPAVVRSHPSLPFTDPGSISVGTVTAGHLVRGKELPLRGPHHRVLEEHAARATRWGTEELVDALLAAATDVAAAHPGAVLSAGNIARRGGGRLPWSISHKAGRDADLGFYLVDEQGRDVQVDTLLQLAGPDGTVSWEGQELRFDVARNYLLLESLLLSDRISIQYVFVADFLVAQLRAEAKRRGAPGRVRKALETFVRQPRGTLPHDDHFHVRVSCSPEDRLEGCRNIVDGREVVPDDRSWRQRVASVEALLDAPEGATRRDAARTLGLLRAAGTREALEARLVDDDPEVRRAAFEALAVLWKRPPVEAIGAILRGSDDPAVLEIGMRLLRAGGRSSRSLVRDLTTDLRVIPDQRWFLDGEFVVRLEAAVVAGWLADERLFRPLAALAGDPDPRVRRVADWALRLTTNHAVLAPDGSPITDGEVLVEAWTSWQKKAGNKRARWLRDGFETAGVDVRRRSRAAARALLGMIVSGETHLAFNAQRILAAWCPGRGPGVGLQDRWWIRRKWKSGLERCFR